jgi:hypothetical protein
VADSAFADFLEPDFPVKPEPVLLDVGCFKINPVETGLTGLFNKGLKAA